MDCKTADEQKKHEAIHRLLSLELDFIDFMHAGIQRYSRPLRHCVLSGTQHSAVFQNVEKVQMLCQAHEMYALGLREPNRVLSQLQHNHDFVRFVKEPALEPGQPSISAFIFKSLQHIRELFVVLQDIFLHTPPQSPDHATLKQVIQVMNNCVTNITSMSNARVQSLTSLSSHTKSSSSCGCSGRGGLASSSSDSSSKATEILLQHYTSPRNTIPASQKIIFRAPTLEDKAAWKSLLEQKVLRARGGHIENVGTSETFRSGIT
ncbi:hypothetical protein C0Q70_10573 [Pomacea canaliculata]|uniref:DH domain-containing protein n=1 Tax=Pomacea canaliculata TaxID=400727 RepID=A0A2T7P3L4_POMCA|nr:hypothetical protein C0Q70_10573 [Pomacea canaliculata]